MTKKEVDIDQSMYDVVHTPRERWTRKIEFTFACVGFAVGYGNFWRFPYKCFKNGGGAFLIAFIISIIVAGIPLFMMELSLGQFSQAGPLKTWNRICPIMSGIGYGMVVVCALVSIYYNVILAWSCLYFFNSFKSVLPWTDCHSDWTSHNCTYITSTNRSDVIDNMTSSVTSAILSRDFFVNNVLQITKSIDNVGGLLWQPTLCLIFAWLLVYFCIWKGIRTTGKIVYVTATLPYLMLFILFAKSLALPGSLDGISYFITPVWERLRDTQVWVDAASQVFYSLTLGFGVMLTFASYNNRVNNVYRDALIISITDALTSVFSGFVVFSFLGYMAEMQGKSITDPTIATDGPGLVFIVYPAALATLPQPHIWSVIFFLMLIMLGLDSQFGQVELICACIIEEYPKRLKKYKEIVVLAVCAILFLFGLLCVTESGMYWFTLIDSYSAGSSLLFLGLAEIITVSWFYGAETFRENIEEMVRFRISYFWVALWKYITPVIIGIIFLFGLITHRPLTYEDTYIFPPWANTLGWLMAASSMICVPTMAIIKYVNTDVRGSPMERLRYLIQPKKNFDPEASAGENTALNVLQM